MASRVDALIDAAYATALDFRVGKSFAAAYTALSEGEAVVDGLSTHIARARQIAASRHDETRIDLPNITLCVDQGLVDATLFDWDRMLSKIDRVTIPGRADLASPNSWRDIAVWAHRLLSKVESDAVFVSFLSETDARQNAILRRVRPAVGNMTKLRVIFPSLDRVQGSSDATLLQRMLGLTERQAEIAGRIAQGQSANEIAKGMGIRAHTVRDHIKSIYERTDLNKQTDLAVLVGELSLMANTLAEPGQTGPVVHQRMTNFFWTADGRRVCFSDCGDQHGRVVLKMHSSFGGRWVWEPTAETLHRYGIRLLIVERPGVGLTDPAADSRGTAIVSDAIALLDHLGVDQAYGLGTSGGTFELAEAIAAHPERFSGATFISARAFHVEADEDDYVAQVAALPTDAGALIMESLAASQTEEGWRDAVRMVLEVNEVDQRYLDDDALMDMHVRQQRSAACNGFEGQLLEWKAYGKPRVPPALPRLPYAVVVGAEDKLAHVAQGTSDWASHLGVEPVLVDGAGHLIFLTHTEDVLAAAGLVTRS